MDFNLDAIIFMKFGYHALENEHDIVLRKKQEFQKTGKIFWGYGGTICHPLNQIQPFVKEMNSNGKKVYLAMSLTSSRPGMEGITTSMFTPDGLAWENVPPVINVTGSKYALYL